MALCRTRTPKLPPVTLPLSPEESAAPPLENPCISSSLPSRSLHYPSLEGFSVTVIYWEAQSIVTPNGLSLCSSLSGVTLVTLVTVVCGWFLDGGPHLYFINPYPLQSNPTNPTTQLESRISMRFSSIQSASGLSERPTNPTPYPTRDLPCHQAWGEHRRVLDAEPDEKKQHTYAEYHGHRRVCRVMGKEELKKVKVTAMPTIVVRRLQWLLHTLTQTRSGGLWRERGEARNEPSASSVGLCRWVSLAPVPMRR